MKLLLSSLLASVLLSNCTYHTYVEPEPKPAPVVTRRPVSKPATVKPTTSADGFQAVTKPSSYSN